MSIWSARPQTQASEPDELAQSAGRHSITMLRALPRVARIAVQRPVLQSRRALVTKFSKVRRKPLAASASKLPAAAARAALAESWPLAMPPVRRV